eukprot:759407-Hanusia_phi.AAC.5
MGGKLIAVEAQSLWIKTGSTSIKRVGVQGSDPSWSFLVNHTTGPSYFQTEATGVSSSVFASLSTICRRRARATGGDTAPNPGRKSLNRRGLRAPSHRSLEVPSHAKVKLGPSTVA